VAELFAKVTPIDKRNWNEELDKLKKKVSPDKRLEFFRAVNSEKEICFFFFFFSGEH
jgi:hypothetical protein